MFKYRKTNKYVVTHRLSGVSSRQFQEVLQRLDARADYTHFPEASGDRTPPVEDAVWGPPLENHPDNVAVRLALLKKYFGGTSLLVLPVDKLEVKNVAMKSEHWIVEGQFLIFFNPFDCPSPHTFTPPSGSTLTCLPLMVSRP